MAIRHLIAAAALAAATASCEGDACEDGMAAGMSLLQASRTTVPRADTQPKLLPNEHYWSRRGRDERMSSSTPFTAPSNFSAGPSWVWKNELDEQVRHSPLIDSDMNVYVATATRVRKFSRTGALLWTWQADASHGKMVMGPALYKSTIFAVAGAGLNQMHIYSLDMRTGRPNWVKSHDQSHGGEASSLFAYNDTLIVPAKQALSGPVTEDMSPMLASGNNKIVAMRAQDGSQLWEYQMDDVVWNAAFATPGDGTLLAGTACGTVFKISWEGKLIWKAGTTGKNCCPGGGALGENGVYYTESRDDDSDQVGVAAYRVTDGALLWNRTLGGGGCQYPAVHRLGTDGPLAVVAAFGMPAGRAWETELEPVPKSNSVVAMDALTGDVLWQFEEEPWMLKGAAGDLDYLTRLNRGPNEDMMCAPDVQGIPLIAGDGTVYGSSSHSGDLEAIKDRDGNGIIDESEVSVFHTDNCFLNSPSLAPGMLVAAPCWGPMYVFLDDE